MLAIMLANINEVKNNLSHYVDAAIAGKEVILSRYNVPVARIVATQVKVHKKNKRVLGRSKNIGKILGDLTGPFIPSSDWNMLDEHSHSFY